MSVNPWVAGGLKCKGPQQVARPLVIPCATPSFTMVPLVRGAELILSRSEGALKDVLCIM